MLNRNPEISPESDPCIPNGPPETLDTFYVGLSRVRGRTPPRGIVYGKSVDIDGVGRRPVVIQDPLRDKV